MKFNFLLDRLTSGKYDENNVPCVRYYELVQVFLNLSFNLSLYFSVDYLSFKMKYEKLRNSNPKQRDAV